MHFTDTEWSIIANALRVAASLNSEPPRDCTDTEAAHWHRLAARQRQLAERIETEQGV